MRRPPVVTSLRGATKQALATLAVVLMGCAPIKTTSKVKVYPKPNRPPLVLGSDRGQITARGAEIGWSQQGRTLDLELQETRRCHQVLHQPVVREEVIIRKAGGALYWEYGVSAVLLGVGLAALIRPEAFSRSAINSEGEEVENRSGGYRIGGIFTGLSAVVLGVAVYDTIRARDEVRYVDAYRVQMGKSTTCAQPIVPLRGRKVELIIGDWRTEGTPDDRGRVSFALPAELDLATAPRRTPPNSDPDAGQATADKTDPGTTSGTDKGRGSDTEAEARKNAKSRDATNTNPSGKTGRQNTAGDEDKAPDRGSETRSPDGEGSPAAPASDAAIGASSTGAAMNNPSTSESDAPGPTGDAIQLRRAVILLDGKRAMAIDFVVPFTSTEAQSHSGHGSLPPRGAARFAHKTPEASTTTKPGLEAASDLPAEADDSAEPKPRPPQGAEPQIPTEPESPAVPPPESPSADAPEPRQSDENPAQSSDAPQ